MATAGEYFVRSAQAAADLRQLQYIILTQTAAGVVNMASGAASVSGVTGPIGTLVNKPASGQAATVQYMGEGKIRVGNTTIAQGAWLTNDSSGCAVTAVSGDLCIGRALEASGATAINQIIRYLGQPAFPLLRT